MAERELIIAKSLDKGVTKFAMTVDRERPAPTARTALAPGTSLLDVELLEKMGALMKLDKSALLAALGIVDEWLDRIA